MNDTQLALRILSAIQRHGIEHPIPGHQLAEMFDIDLRRVQSIVEELVDSGQKIGSSMKRPCGYFLAKHPDELTETAEILRTRGRKYFARANKLLDFGSNQPTVFEQQEEAA